METINVPAHAFRRALANATLFASTDKARPTLNAVHLRVTSDKVTVEATDSYMLARHTVELDTPRGLPHAVGALLQGTEEPATFEDFSALVELDDAKELARQLKRTTPKFGDPSTALDVTDEKLHVNGAVDTTVRLITHSEFPRTDQLWTDHADKATHAPTVAFNTKFIAKFGKVDVGDPVVPVKVTFGEDDTKPAHFSIGPDFAGLIMPVRTN